MMPEYPIRHVKVRATTRIVQRDDRYRCPYCDRPYGTIPGIGSHLISHHAGEPIPTENEMRLLQLEHERR